ncbi:MAG: hypothetical protein KDI30_12270 [Pseudomonadales bacterium]|nr:hypothetical protein [Pseudomonadales bacterium]
MTINISQISLGGIAISMLVLAVTTSEAVYIAALYVILFLLSLFIDEELMGFFQKLIEKRLRRNP